MIETAKNETAGMNAITNLVAVTNGQVTTTSLKIAEVFEKQHKDVLKAIRELEIPEEFNRRNFAPVEYIDAKGEKRPACQITRDGFTLLAMGFTGSRAMQFKLAYIEAFNEMEKMLNEPTSAVNEAEFDMFRLIGKFGEMKRNPITEALAFAIRKPSSAETVLYRINHPEAAPHKVAKARGLSLRQVYTHLREGELNGVNGRMPDLVTRGEFESFKNETRSNENQLAVGLENTTEVLKSISQSFANIMDRLSARLEEQDRKLVSAPAPRAKSSAFRGFSGKLMSETAELKRQGMSTREIAASLGIGESTVRTYLKREREELNFNGNKI